MKKVYLILFALILALSCLALPVMAEGTAEAEAAETVKTVSTVVGVSGVAGISVIIVSIVAFFVKNFSSLAKLIKNIASAFTTIFGKEGKIENMPKAIGEIRNDFSALSEEFKSILAEEQAKFDELKAEYDTTKKENNEYKRAISLFFLYANNINPYVKAELVKLMSGEIPFKEDIEETIKDINEIVRKAQEQDRTNTPILNSMSEE
jgi:methyl-accepting chemotaxis protein